MQRAIGNHSVDVFSTCPQSADGHREEYIQNVADVARWAEQYGCRGILVYTDNRLVDSWLVAQIIIQNTNTLCPLVAVQPMYMHPYTVAKMVSSFGHLYGRRLFLNMVAGGFKNDLEALADSTPHDKRYDRLIEYTTIIKRLLADSSQVSYAGEFYRINRLRLTPPLAQSLFPGITISGSSEAGLSAARSLGAIAVQYPKQVGEYKRTPQDHSLDSGMRIGIITREDEDLAWKIAHERFPEDRKGQMTHQLAMKVSDSVWHKQLSEIGEETKGKDSPYWMVPFENYKTFCPYLVGSYKRVAEELASYIAMGYKTFILDIPPNEEELHHTNIVFKQASNGSP
jgi:alkanesulfonate monooxygenase